MPLLALLTLPFLSSLVAALLPTRARNRAAALAGLTALACAVGAALYLPAIARGEVPEQRLRWVPGLGLDLVLRLDGFAWLFCLLVLGIGALVVLYARYYLSPTDPVPRFFAFLLAFMGAMVGVVLSGNLLQLAFFWELTSLFSFLLIGYWYHRRDAQRGARMALTVTGAGGLALLGGVLLLGHLAGSYELAAVLASGARVQAHPLYPVALVLVLLGAFTKSAQFPFHFWLPNAMAAPTPVSAYLHSATMVKLGVFLLARLWPVLSGTELWFWLVGGAGLVTLLHGAWVALFQRDLKGLLAYSTLSHLGLITLLLGLNSPLAAVAAVFHIMNHAAFKASLFMAVGIIDHETGTRDIQRLSGLWRPMPYTATLAIVASAAMAGVPLLNGFLSKEMFFAETVFLEGTPLVEWGLPLLATVAGMGSVAYSLRFTVDVFFGPSSAKALPREPEEPPRWMRVPVDLLVLLCVVVGVAPAATVGRVLDEAARPVVGGTLPAFSLALWHGFNLPLLMSLVALAGGVGCYLLLRRRGRARGLPEQAWTLVPLEGRRVFTSLLARLTLASRGVRRQLLSAGLQRQLLLLVLVTLVLGAAALRHGGAGPGDRPRVPLAPAFAALWLVGGVAALGAAWQAKYHRLAALMLSGVAGVVCCITFIWFSAPDLALTQLVVEVVTTLLILLGLRWLPPREPQRGEFTRATLRQARWRRSRDLVVALGAGGGMAALAYAVSTRNLPQGPASFFLANALEGGGGRNVVNVMLVDFRGFDTFGEGVVLGLVALTVYALLRRFRPAEEMLELPPQQRALPPDLQTDLINPRRARDTAVGYLMVPAVLVRLLFPVTFVVAVFFFLRGHNAPGGGFVAGLVVSVGVLLQYLVSGTEWVEERLKLAPRTLIAVGLLLVLGTSAGALFAGYPLLTSHTWHLSLPLLGEVHVASALFFDLGIFSLVLGSTLFILVALAHQSIRAHRTPGEP
ncbi:monovalent cation/H+ antiporter subunit A [Aggregicoccus sp. 17bor-14]|uniref:monovalent cation/H+ antiporter subunit A n=1 Tax=Myxococcaceae TaxID=31 RepID=UPI00129CA22A|nr:MULTISPECIES: monovalent cation/H+ antiporter subunit A [Myxococcaceae]MBF5042887.1 monovalent cation/H+ antiporter subunit A [Simulacricoccus sp. 17bor-14]MRI88654.1 monovalent cation/H+ antiporter subunit A [Aggregicoccus sp. 17bor-14]